jgi:hypothetical protein
MNKFPFKLSCFLGSLLLAGHFSAGAQEKTMERSLTAQPYTYAIKGQLYQATGYGRAHFGMTVEDVKAIVAVDYPAALKTLKDEIDPSQRTRALAIVVADLAPGPGLATVTYVFGATSLRLIAVNVYWLFSGIATPAQQAQLTEAASVLASDFVGYQWPVFDLVRGLVVAPGVLVVFAGKDEAGGAVEVRLDGVAFNVEKRLANATAAALPPEHRTVPAGPAQLRLSIMANVNKPDIYVKQ